MVSTAEWFAKGVNGTRLFHQGASRATNAKLLAGFLPDAVCRLLFAHCGCSNALVASLQVQSHAHITNKRIVLCLLWSAPQTSDKSLIF